MRRALVAAASARRRAAAVAACERDPRRRPPTPKRRRWSSRCGPGPASGFPGPTARSQGFDHDLLARFARERKLPLDVVAVDPTPARCSTASPPARPTSAQAASYRPPPATRARIAARATDARPPLAVDRRLHAVEPVLIYNTDGFKPRDLERPRRRERSRYVEATGIETRSSRTVRARRIPRCAGSRWRCRRPTR